MSLVLFIDFCFNVIDSMKSNPKFPAPDVSIADIETAFDNLQSSHLIALKGDKVAKEEVLIYRKELEKLLKLNALYVDRIAAGNEAIIASSGYHSSKQPAPANRPEFRAIAGNESGCIILKRKAVQGAAAYLWQQVANPLPDNEKEWTWIGVSVQANYTIKYLESGDKIWFRVAAITRSGQLPWSEPIMKVAP